MNDFVAADDYLDETGESLDDHPAGRIRLLPGTGFGLRAAALAGMIGAGVGLAAAAVAMAGGDPNTTCCVSVAPV